MQPSDNEPYVGRGFIKTQARLSHNPSPQQEPHLYTQSEVIQGVCVHAFK